MRTNAIAVLLAISLLPSLALAATQYVDVNGGGDYLTIQEGIDASADGDIVLVAAGTYVGSLNRDMRFGMKDLVVMSEDGPGSTIIDCQSQDRAFYFNYTGQDTTSAIRGFTIRNGYTTDFNGGAIIFGGCGVTIEDCIFEDCYAIYNGGALSTAYSQVGPNVRNCVFVGNQAGQRGGAVIVDHSSARFNRCLFYGNWTDEAVYNSNGGGALWANSITYGSGHVCTVTYCTFAGNSSPGLGTGVGAWGDCGGFWVTHSIVAFNNGPTLGFDSDPLLEDFVFSIVYGNEGGDAAPGYSVLISEDPLFCDMASGDFELCENSPALPAGNTWSTHVGYGDMGCGECDSPVQESTWGRLKAMYR